MTLLTRRRPPDPATAAALAAAREAETRAEIERARALAELRREQAAADRAAALEAERDARHARKERQAAQAQERAERRAKLNARVAKLRPVVPLLIINGGAVYAQAMYAYEDVAPDKWNDPSKVVFAVLYAIAMECIAVYVQWHAHDALLLRSYSTAAKLRRASWTIAAIMGGLNYSHFADDHLKPTPAGIGFGMLSLLSPWLWGLHTRRVQHVQLLAEDPSLVDDAGAVFSPERRRAFPIRSWAARRWSIDHGVRDPRAAWAGYHRERDARRARRRRPAVQPAEGIDQNTATMLAIVRLQASRARQAVAGGWPTRRREPVVSAATMPAIETAKKTVTATVTRPPAASPRKRATTVRRTATKAATETAKAVARWHAKYPDLTHKDLAAKSGIPLRSIQRYRPAKENR